MGFRGSSKNRYFLIVYIHILYSTSLPPLRRHCNQYVKVVYSRRGVKMEPEFGGVDMRDEIFISI